MMASEGCVESGLPKNCDKALKKSKFFDREMKNDRNKNDPICPQNTTEGVPLPPLTEIGENFRYKMV